MQGSFISQSVKISLVYFIAVVKFSNTTIRNLFSIFITELNKLRSNQLKSSLLLDLNYKMWLNKLKAAPVCFERTLFILEKYQVFT